MGNRSTILLLVFSLTSMQAQAKFRNPFSKSQASASVVRPSGEVPFRLVGSYLVLVKGSLNGVKGCNLLIDTGTNPTVLDAAMARRLGVEMGKAGDLRTLSGNTQIRTGVLSSVTVGPVTTKSVPVFIADFIQAGLPVRIDAVVGLDVLKADSFTIDYEARRIVFGSVPAYDNWVPFADGPPLITVTMQIDGRMKRLLVDTGAEGLFLFRDQNRQDETLERAALQNGSHVSLARNREQVEIPEVRLRNLRRMKQPAYLVRTQDQTLRDFDGLLGMPALGIKRVVFDFERGRLGWR